VKSAMRNIEKKQATTIFLTLTGKW
jgi:hypothetical protein